MVPKEVQEPRCTARSTSRAIDTTKRGKQVSFEGYRAISYLIGAIVISYLGTKEKFAQKVSSKKRKVVGGAGEKRGNK